MRVGSHQGSIPVAVLLAGIFFVFLMAAGTLMNNQAQASGQLERQLGEAQSRLAESGLQPVDGPAVKGARIDTKKTTLYSKEGLEFRYPASLELKEGGEESNPNFLELATNQKYFGDVLVPRTQLRVSINRNLNYRFEKIEDYLTLTPYAKKHRKSEVNGHPVLAVTNIHNDQTWVMVVFEHSPLGPYTTFNFQPGDTFRTTDTVDVIIPSVKIKGP